MKDFLSHLFIPKESNNHRAKVLHHTNIFLTIIFLFLASFFIQRLRISYPSVLGISADISSDQLLFLTNKERQSAGLGSLVMNGQLAQAASEKAQDMFTYNYWAHSSPAGKTPWDFIRSSGYKYVYAGENLARGFATAEAVVNAWMASPDHRANMLSANYQDVGFSVQTGKLNGEDTVLVVEEFGNQYMPVARGAAQEIAPVQKTAPVQEVVPTQEVAPVQEIIPTQAVIPVSNPNSAPKSVQAVRKQPLINTATLSSNIYYVFIIVFIVALFLDMIIIEKKKVMRFVGHNIDHVLYLLLILILIGIWSKGVII